MRGCSRSRVKVRPLSLNLHVSRLRSPQKAVQVSAKGGLGRGLHTRRCRLRSPHKARFWAIRVYSLSKAPSI